MHIIIKRRYFPAGTNGKLYINGVLQCFTIELPWLNNRQKLSCIPEGTYPLVFRNSPKFHLHFLVKDVPGRDLILVHPANNALRDLKGCIAPVTAWYGLPGCGTGSRFALSKLTSMALAAGNEPHFLTIQNEENDA